MPKVIASPEAARKGYCARLIDQLRTVEDAITGNKLSTREQLIFIGIDAQQKHSGGTARATDVRSSLGHANSLPAAGSKSGSC